MALEDVALEDVALEDVVVGDYNVLYFPNGVDSLRSGSVATTFAVDFHKQTNRSPEPARYLAELPKPAGQSASRTVRDCPSPFSNRNTAG